MRFLVKITHFLFLFVANPNDLICSVRQKRSESGGGTEGLAGEEIGFEPVIIEAEPEIFTLNLAPKLLEPEISASLLSLFFNPSFFTVNLSPEALSLIVDASLIKIWHSVRKYST